MSADAKSTAGEGDSMATIDEMKAALAAWDAYWNTTYDDPVVMLEAKIPPEIDELFTAKSAEMVRKLLAVYDAAAALYTAQSAFATNVIDLRGLAEIVEQKHPEQAARLRRDADLLAILLDAVRNADT